MRRRLVHDVNDHFVRTISIETNPVADFSLRNIVTHHRTYIWNKFLRTSRTIVDQNANNINTWLSQNENNELIKETKLHRRLTHYQCLEDVAEMFDSDTDSSDEEFFPAEETSENSDELDDFQMNTSLHEDLNVSNLSTGSTSTSCIKTILRKLQQIENKHNRNNETVDSLLKKYFTSKGSISKLFMYKMDILNLEVFNSFRKELFKKTDSKQARINKIYLQLKSMPQLLIYESSDDEVSATFQPKSLRQIYWNFIV